MPYEWLDDSAAPGQSGAVLFRRRLLLRPHRSLGARGFVAFIAATALLLALPLLALVGQAALWVIFAFAIAGLVAVWTALRRNARDLALTEELTLSRDEVRLVRRNPDGTSQVWTANPHWVRVSLYSADSPVPDYLTLSGDGREVEIGAFLSPAERRHLAADLRHQLGLVRQPH